MIILTHNKPSEEELRGKSNFYSNSTYFAEIKQLLFCILSHADYEPLTLMKWSINSSLATPRQKQLQTLLEIAKEDDKIITLKVSYLSHSRARVDNNIG